VAHTTWGGAIGSRDDKAINSLAKQTQTNKHTHNNSSNNIWIGCTFWKIGGLCGEKARDYHLKHVFRHLLKTKKQKKNNNNPHQFETKKMYGIMFAHRHATLVVVSYRADGYNKRVLGRGAKAQLCAMAKDERA